MLFEASIKKELIRTFSATLIVLLTVVLIMLFIITLNFATKGSLSPADILPEASYRLLGNLSTILALCLFISTTALLSRLYRDSEMIIWLVSGKSLFSILKPVFSFALPILAIISITTLFIWPLANSQIHQLRLAFQQQSDLSRVAPGVFQFSRDGKKVFFIDKDRLNDKVASNIFLINYANNKTAIISAKTAEVWQDKEKQYLRLNQGQSTETNNSLQPQSTNKAFTQGKWNISNFDQYNLLIEKKIVQPLVADKLPVQQQSTLNLITNPTPNSQAELSWRLGLIFASINCILLAVAITYVNPRNKYNASIAVSILAFFTYYNLLTFGKKIIAAEQIGLLPWLAYLHGSVFIVALFLLCKRQYNWSLRPYLSSRFK